MINFIHAQVCVPIKISQSPDVLALRIFIIFAIHEADLLLRLHPSFINGDLITLVYVSTFVNIDWTEVSLWNILVLIGEEIDRPDLILLDQLAALEDLHFWINVVLLEE